MNMNLIHIRRNKIQKLILFRIYFLTSTHFFMGTIREDDFKTQHFISRTNEIIRSVDTSWNKAKDGILKNIIAIKSRYTNQIMIPLENEDGEHFQITLYQISLDIKYKYIYKDSKKKKKNLKGFKVIYYDDWAITVGDLITYYYYTHKKEFIDRQREQKSTANQDNDQEDDFENIKINYYQEVKMDWKKWEEVIKKCLKAYDISCLNEKPDLIARFNYSTISSIGGVPERNRKVEEFCRSLILLRGSYISLTRKSGHWGNNRILISPDSEEDYPLVIERLETLIEGLVSKHLMQMFYRYLVDYQDLFSSVDETLYFDPPISTKELCEIICKSDNTKLNDNQTYMAIFKDLNTNEQEELDKHPDMVVGHPNSIPKYHPYFALRKVTWTQFNINQHTRLLYNLITDSIWVLNNTPKRYKNNKKIYSQKLQSGLPVSGENKGFIHSKYAGYRHGKQSYKKKQKQAFRHQMKEQ